MLGRRGPRRRALALLGAALRGFGSAPAGAAAAAPGAPPRAPPALRKLLIANRGEIACRVAATARRLGIPTVAVFSDADRGARHVAAADEAVRLGPAAAAESYLRGDAVLEAAARTGADAVHPGYGFLSENAGFAAACAAAGVAFVGPPPSAIAAMGDKAAAKALMAAAGVPVVPGAAGGEQSEAALEAAAAAVGFPLLVKAVAGGGGKGMKLAASAAEFLPALRAARREAAAAFGRDDVILERYILRSRHVEVQVLADRHGGCVHLHERDCSLQRRHQKVIEEAPAPGVGAARRAALGAAAVAAARAAGYEGAGTVEFIVDVGARGGGADIDDAPFYFLEMNTRLQVEHPVTEAVTGLDLVELQLRVAAGEPLPISQADVGAPRGHAFEARLYAEQPRRGFLPAGGRVLRWAPPAGAAAFDFGADGAAGVRVDSGVAAGDLVGVHYDPMIAKVVARGADRPAALAALRAALGGLQVGGLPTNLEFMRRAAAHAGFRAGGIDTGFIAAHEAELLAPEPAPPAEAAALAAAAFAAVAAARAPRPAGAAAAAPPWAAADGFRLNHAARVPVAFSHPDSGAEATLTLELGGGSDVAVSGFGGEEGGAAGGGAAPRRVSVRGLALAPGGGDLTAEVDGARVRGAWSGHAAGDDEVLDLWLPPLDGGGAGELEGGQQQRWRHFQFRRPIARRWARRGAAAATAGAVVTPMPGKVVKVFVAEGDDVAEGAPLAAVEAMKMEHTVRAPCAGRVAELRAFAGAQVDDGHVLATVVPPGAEAAAAAAGGG